MLSRRAFLQTTGAGAVAARILDVTDPAEAAPALAQAQGTQKPNLLFMLVDNLGPLSVSRQEQRYDDSIDTVRTCRASARQCHDPSVSELGAGDADRS